MIMTAVAMIIPLHVTWCLLLFFLKLFPWLLGHHTCLFSRLFPAYFSLITSIFLFATPLSWYCHPGSYLQLTVLLILEWCYCSNYSSYVEATPHLRWQIHLISLDSHGFQMYLFGCHLCVSIWSVQIVQKETYHLLNQLFLLHSGSHFKAPSSPQSPKPEMKKSFWIPSSALCLTSKPLLMPANISQLVLPFSSDSHCLISDSTTSHLDLWGGLLSLSLPSSNPSSTLLP